jgi:hypothetical protein
VQADNTWLLVVLTQVLALASVLVAALSLLLSYRDRVAPIRTALYTRQVEVLTQLYDTLFAVAAPVVSAALHSRSWGRLSIEEKRAEVISAMEKSSDLQVLVCAQNAVIPTPILESVDQLMPLIFTGYVDALTKTPEEAAADYEPLGQALFALRTAIRTTLGTDHLHKTVLRLLGVGQRKWKRDATVPRYMTHDELRDFYDLVDSALHTPAEGASRER